ncbi:glycoside hydrolase family 61 protein [Ceratobasidium sp. AG-Ba]|nr:glycoside hydrolase family 61 protein [Ceratobasidium sp. AG-Ba]
MQIFQALPAPLAHVFQWLASSFSSSEASRSILPFIPRPVKWLALIVFLFNIKSWPGVWHARVFRPVFKIRLSGLFIKRGKEPEWWTRKSPVGRSVFPTEDGSDKGALSVLKCWASPDDCDWNGHLSNSCYARNLDPARMQACIDWFPSYFGDGGWVALGGAHYHYIREIPVNASYEIRVSIGGWEDKWIYLVAKFVTHPKQKSNSSKSTHPSTATTIPNITTPSTPLTTGPSTPGEPATISSMTPASLDASRVDTKLSSKPSLRTHDDDGALIHCIAVSTYVFKHGRLTVPPKVAIAMSGFSLGEVGDKSNWAAATALRAQKPSPIRDFLRGGWKNAENKFWESSPEVEAERVRRVAALRQLTEGMDGLRAY